MSRNLSYLNWLMERANAWISFELPPPSFCTCWRCLSPITQFYCRFGSLSWRRNHIQPSSSQSRQVNRNPCSPITTVVTTHLYKMAAQTDATQNGGSVLFRAFFIHRCLSMMVSKSRQLEVCWAGIKPPLVRIIIILLQCNQEENTPWRVSVSIPRWHDIVLSLVCLHVVVFHVAKGCYVFCTCISPKDCMANTQLAEEDVD